MHIRDNITIRSQEYRLLNYLVRNAVVVAIVSASGLVVPVIYPPAWYLYGIIAVLFLILGILFALIQSTLEYLHIGYLIDKNSISFREGMISTSVTAIPFVRITNVTFHQGLLGRIMSVGDIYIDQEDSHYRYMGLDAKVCQDVIDAIQRRSNIQPIAKNS